MSKFSFGDIVNVPDKGKFVVTESEAKGRCCLAKDGEHFNIYLLNFPVKSLVLVAEATKASKKLAVELRSDE